MHIELLYYVVLPQVHPPDSPDTSSPLQGSLHSQGSSETGEQAQEDFVMVDFVSTLALHIKL